MRRLLHPSSQAVLLALAVLGGCTSLAPATAPTPLAQIVPARLPAPAGEAATAQPVWDALLQDDRLRSVVAHALAHNRDLRTAALNVERSRAAARVADADRWPTLQAGATANRAPNAVTGKQTTVLQAGLTQASYEVDLLGRVRSQSEAAAQAVRANEAAWRAARLAVIAQTSASWLNLVADEEQLDLLRNTLRSRGESLRLTRLRADAGTVSDIELRAAQSLAAQAAASVAQLERQRQQDRHALAALVGDQLPESLWPAEGERLSSHAWLAPVPVALDSAALLARPDIMQAEAQLRAAGARIGAARAALWPRISLTGSAGSVSAALSGLFGPGTWVWTLGAQAVATVFDGGRNRANVAIAEVDRDIAIAQYEQTVLRAFQQASDALTAQATWAEQARQSAALAAAEAERARLTRLKLDAGTASLLETLDAERSVAAAQQADVQTRLAQILNRLSLYQALGGDEAAQPLPPPPSGG